MARALRRLNWTEMLGYIGGGLSPYYLLLAPWADGTPPEWLVRLPSVLAAAGVAALAWVIGRDRGVPGLAWRCGVAVAVSPFLAWHAREARWYTLAWLLGALSLRHALLAIDCGGWRHPAATAAWGLMAAIVYPPAAVPLVVALGGIPLVRALPVPAAPKPDDDRPLQGGAATARSPRQARWITRPSIVVGFLLALGGVVWSWQALIKPVVSEGAAGFGFSNVGAFSVAAVAYTPVAFATGYTLGPGPAEWHARPRQWPSAWECAVLGAGVACLALLAVLGLRRLWERGAGREAVLLAALVIIPALAVVMAAAWTGHRYAPRHAGMSFVPALVLAAAGTLAPAGGRWSRFVPRAVAVLLLILQAGSLMNLHSSPRYLREQVGRAARYVAGIGSGRDLVLVFGGIDLPWQRYDLGLAPARIVYPDDTQTWTPEAVRGMAEAHDRVIVVRGLIMEVAGEGPLREALAGATRLLSTTAFPGVTVEVRASAPAGGTR